MEFSIWCPTDGTVEVSLDDVDSIVVRSGSDVEVVFVCPVCGERITFAAQVPHALLAGLDDAWIRVDDEDERSTTLQRERARSAAALDPVLEVPGAESAVSDEARAD